jgi:hypothetical protein
MLLAVSLLQLQLPTSTQNFQPLVPQILDAATLHQNRLTGSNTSRRFDAQGALHGSDICCNYAMMGQVHCREVDHNRLSSYDYAL